MKTRRWLSFRGVQKLTCQGSARRNGELMDAFASVIGCWEPFLCAKHIIRDEYEMLENISVGRKHMVEVEGRMFKCVPGR